MDLMICFKPPVAKSRDELDKYDRLAYQQVCGRLVLQGLIIRLKIS